MTGSSVTKLKWKKEVRVLVFGAFKLHYMYKNNNRKKKIQSLWRGAVWYRKIEVAVRNFRSEYKNLS